MISLDSYLQEDVQLETGEYFLSDKKKSAKKWQEGQAKQAEKTAESKRRREEAFVPPKVLMFRHIVLLSSYCLLLTSPLSLFCCHRKQQCRTLASLMMRIIMSLQLPSR